MEKQDPPIDKARIKAALEQAQTSLINYPGFSPEQLKVMADAKEAINQRMTAMGEAMRKAFEPFNAEILDRMAEVSKALSEALRKNEDGYHREIKSLFAFLTSKGYIIPPDYEAFADWFFYEKHPDLPLNIEGLRTLATVEPSHFREFHEWKEAKFLAKEEKPKQPKIRINALYHFYAFEGSHGGKADIKEAAKLYECNENAFVQEFYRVSKQDYRRRPAYVSELQIVISLLEKGGKPTWAAYEDLRGARKPREK